MMRAGVWTVVSLGVLAGGFPGVPEIALLVPPAAAAGFSGEIGFEGRLFPADGTDRDLSHATGSIRLEPEFVHDWDDGDQRLAVMLFTRVDSQDSHRSHVDIREFYWRRTYGRSLDLYFGLRKVFWGVTESVHLVDIINQTDLVENPDTEDKLGQPMLAATWINDWGTLDFFVMPIFRERTFSGRDGRLAPPLSVDTGHPLYASDAEDTHVDLALRWSHYIGDFDMGVAHFSGTSREPVLIPDMRSGGPVLVPYYGLLDQTSLDVQYTRGDWAYKLEAVSRELDGKRSTAAVGGFEYTLVGVLGSDKDLGLIAEYQYDDRPTPVAGDHDLAVGGRLTFNDIQDTDLLAFAAIDTEDGSVFASVEGNRRLQTNWEIEVEARLFFNTDPGNLLHTLRRDDYLQIELVRYF